MSNREPTPGMTRAATRITKWTYNPTREWGRQTTYNGTIAAMAEIIARELAEEIAYAEDARRELKAAVSKLLGAISYPQNGYHSCRYCDAGTDNAWRHSEHCWYKTRVELIDDARGAGLVANHEDGER